MSTRKLHTLVVGPFEVNCYLLWDEKSLEGFIVDPGAEAKAIIAGVQKIGFNPNAILLTHGHGDHIAAVAEVKDKFNAALYIGAGEEVMIANPDANVSAFFDQPIVAPPPDHSVIDEQLIEIGPLTLRVLATPGHTPAGVCYLDEEAGILFCGDTLFAGSIGRTDLPGGSFNQLIESIRKKILSLPDGIVCLPGHGPQTTVRAERVSNPFLIGGQYA